MRHLAPLSSLVLAALAASACTDAPEGEIVDPEAEEGYEGVSADNDPNAVMDDGKSDAPRYAVPTNLPALVDPEIIVSLEGLTVHIFDRETGFQAVYPAGVGELDSRGRSITPTGHFNTGSDNTDSWWFVPRRTNPSYFAGLPFLRITAENSDGANTYAFHGPIDATLRRGYVSHGCVRMAKQNIIDLFWMMKPHTSSKVTIQQEVERDAAGKKVDVGTTPTLWDVGERITFGASVGPRLD